MDPVSVTAESGVTTLIWSRDGNGDSGKLDLPLSGWIFNEPRIQLWIMKTLESGAIKHWYKGTSASLEPRKYYNKQTKLESTYL